MREVKGKRYEAKMSMKAVIAPAKPGQNIKIVIRGN